MKVVEMFKKQPADMGGGETIDHFVPAGVFLCGRCGTVFVQAAAHKGNYDARQDAEECCICTICHKPVVEADPVNGNVWVRKAYNHDDCVEQRAAELEQKKLDEAEVIEWCDYKGEGFFVDETFYRDWSSYEEDRDYRKWSDEVQGLDKKPDTEYDDPEFGWAAVQRDPKIDAVDVWRSLSEHYDGVEGECSYACEALLNAAIDAFNKLNVGCGLWWPDEEHKVRLPRRSREETKQ